MGIGWGKGLLRGNEKMEVLASKTLTVIIMISGPLSSWTSLSLSHNNLKDRFHEHHFTDEKTKGQVRRVCGIPKVSQLVNRRIKI